MFQVALNLSIATTLRHKVCCSLSGELINLNSTILRHFGQGKFVFRCQDHFLFSSESWEFRFARNYSPSNFFRWILENESHIYNGNYIYFLHKSIFTVFDFLLGYWVCKCPITLSRQLTNFYLLFFRFSDVSLAYFFQEFQF